VNDSTLAFAALGSLPTPVGVVGADGVLRLCNRAWSAADSPLGALAGRTLEVGAEVEAVLATSDRASARELAARLRDTLDGRRSAAEVAFSAPDAEGRERRHRARVEPAGPRAPGMVVLTVFAVDAPAEEGDPSATVRDQPGDPEPGPRDVLSGLPDVFLLTSADLTRLDWASPSYEGVFGRSLEELRRDPRDFLLAVHPHDRERLRASLWRQADGTWRELLRVVRPDGSTRLLRSRAYPVRDGGVVARIVSVFTDVTEMRWNATGGRGPTDRYREIFESCPVGVALIDDKGAVLEANPALAALVDPDAPGRARPPTSVLDLLGPEEHAGTRAALTALATDEVSGWSREAVLHRSGLTTVPVRLQISRLGRRHEDRALALLLVEDISEHRRLETQLRQAQRIESVGRLAGGIAHDFNNIMTVIRGHTDLLLGSIAADDPLKADLEDIQQAAERAAALTGHLLAFSRRNVLQPRLIDLNRVVSGVESMLERVIGEDVELRIEAEPELGVVRADPAQLEQVLLNLVVNSRDAMPRGGRVTIRTFDEELDDTFVEAHLGSSPGPHVALQVADTGEGMEPDTLTRIFEPFFTTKEPGKGTGLGLAMAYGIVKQSGGYIDVVSAPGMGATFTIYLPRVRTEGTRAGEREAAADPGATASPGVRPPREGTVGWETVLVVEDEPRVRALTARVLDSRGFTVLTAESGAAALAAARAYAGTLHLLLTDVVMPGMGGGELAERLQAERAGLRVLFTSGYTDDAVVRQGIVQRDVPFLPKPYSPAELIEHVRAVLDGRKDC
jgi:PAS domain S-box-containing protein